MSWVVDTCILLDVLEDDPEFGRASARCLVDRLNDGLIASPVTLLEMAPAFLGDFDSQRDFLAQCGVSDDVVFTLADVRKGYTPWHQYTLTKRRRGSAKPTKRPIADLMIGAFACRHAGLITRNGKDFHPWFPDLVIINPMTPSN